MITQCTAKFDRHQFEKRPKACTAESRITFNDYGRMHVMDKRIHKYFRGEAPEWVINEHKLREVVVRYLEQRNYIAPQPHKSYEERLAAVDAAARKNYLPRYRALLDRLVNKSVSPVEVQNVDTKIVLEERGFAAIVVAVAYGYYRRGLNSVELANELGMKPPHVRILLYRLRAVAHQIESGESNGRRVVSTVSSDVMDQIRELYNKGLTVSETAHQAGVGYWVARTLLKREGLLVKRSCIRTQAKHETSKEFYDRMKAAGRCVACAQTAKLGRIHCQKCARKAAVRYRALRHRKAAAKQLVTEAAQKLVEGARGGNDSNSLCPS